MEKYQELFSQAKKEIEVTHHLLFVTFPMLKEIKFLTTISNHIIKASRLALESLLEYKKHYKEIDPFPTNFAVMVNIYQTQLERDIRFDKNYARLLTQLLEVEKFEKESKVRFKRKQAYILTTEDFSTITLDQEKVRRYARVAKNFIRDVGELIKNEP